MSLLQQVIVVGLSVSLGGCGLLLDRDYTDGGTDTNRDASVAAMDADDALLSLDAALPDAASPDAFEADATLADAFVVPDGGAPRCVDSRAGLLALYPFDGFNDRVGMHPIRSRMPSLSLTFRPAPQDNIAVFNESTDAYIEAFAGIRGVSVWVRPSSEPGTLSRRGIVNGLSTLGLFQHNGAYHCWAGIISAGMLSEAVVVAPRSVATWSHLRCWQDGAGFTHLAVNGEEAVSPLPNVPATQGEIRLGANADGEATFNQPFEGEMTQLRFWVSEPPICR